MSGRVVIVGAGPAGSTLAALLARQGVDVLVVERARMPRPKPCGECINPGGVAALERLGLLEATVACRPARIVEWRFTDVAGVVARGRFAPADGAALGVRRADFDAALCDAARRAGARVREGVAVADVQRARDGGWTVDLRGRGSRDRVRADLLVGADGLRSIVATRLGLVRRPPRVHKVSLTARVRAAGPPRDVGRLFFSERGTVGLAPVHVAEDEWNATVVFPKLRRPHGLAHRGREIVEELAGALPLEWTEAPRVVDGPWASGPFDRPVRRTVSDAAVLVGDAAGYFDPLTGQGIYRALRSAELAAPTIVEAVRSGRTAARDLAAYDRALRRELRPRRALQRAIEEVVKRDRWRRTALARLARAPAYADRFVRVTGDVASVGSLVHPAAVAAIL